MRVLYMHLQGYKNTDIAAAVHLTPERVSAILCTRWAKLEIAKFHTVQLLEITKTTGGAMNLARSNSGLAAKTMTDLLAAKDPKLRFAAAKDLLDRTGVRVAKDHIDEYSDEVQFKKFEETATADELDAYARGEGLPERFKPPSTLH